MTVSKYFQQVCVKLSCIHAILALISFIVLVIFAISLAIDTTEEDKKFLLKFIIVSFISTIYNIILFILIPSFEGVQI